MTTKLLAREEPAIYKALHADAAANWPWPLPPEWQWHRIGEVTQVVGGGTPRTTEVANFGGEIPWITPADLSGYDAKHISRGARNISALGLASSGAQLMPQGTVMFSSRAPIGYVAIASNPVATNQGFKSFVLGTNLLPDFVYYWLKVARPMAVALASGTTFLEVSGKKIAQLPIPIAPLAVQRSVVAYLDEQLSRLDASVAALHRVQANLKRYRASVLKSACEGRLVPTEAELARAERRTFETGEQLASCIVSKRRASWSGKAKFKEPESPNVETLPQLPTGWVWVRLDAIAEVTGGLAKSASRVSTSPMREVAYLRVANVQRGYFDLSEIKTILATERDVEELKLVAGDVLFNEGGDRDKLGRGHVWNGEIAEAIHQNHVLRARADGAMVLPTYLSMCGNGYGIDWFSEFATQSVNLASISLSTLRKFPIALPPLAEQHRIVAEADRRLSLIRVAEAQVSANLARAQRLRQSILQAAFAAPSSH